MIRSADPGSVPPSGAHPSAPLPTQLPAALMLIVALTTFEPAIGQDRALCGNHQPACSSWYRTVSLSKSQSGLDPQKMWWVIPTPSGSWREPAGI